MATHLIPFIKKLAKTKILGGVKRRVVSSARDGTGASLSDCRCFLRIVEGDAPYKYYTNKTRMVYGLKIGRLKLRYFLQSAEADFVFVDAVSTVRPIQ